MNFPSTRRLALLALACWLLVPAGLAQVTTAPAAPLPPAAATPLAPPAPAVASAAELFPLSDIRLLDGTAYRQQQLNLEYLKKLEPDRLLSWFRREAGLEPKAPPYRGWESEGLALTGHILGFYMSGAGMTVQATGDTVLRDRLNYIVDELAAVQAAHGSGYLLSLRNGKKFFADVSAGNIQVTGLPYNGYLINGVFEPIYTFNKLTLGLREVYLATGNPKARQVLARACEWFGTDVLDKLTDAQVQSLIACEHGSLPESFIQAFQLTSDPRYLAWARRLCEARFLNPLADGNVDFITNYHANSNIPKFTGFEAVHAYTGEARLQTAALNFWTDVVRRRSWVIGGNSAGEHFFAPDGFAKALSIPAGPETCNSVNMLRLTETLFRAAPSAEMLDFYERVLWNHIFAVHDPERGMFNYYTPLRPGAYRVYSDEFDSMWCCVGTGMEVPGKYGQMIYSTTPAHDTLDVNLFIASELRWAGRGLTLRQETKFPEQPATTLLVTSDAPQTFTLRVRHPAWIPQGRLAMRLNGAPVSLDTKPGSYAELRRAWKTGDKLDIDLPMALSTEPLPHDPHHLAVLYGPIVLSGALGRDGLTKYDFWQIGNTIGGKQIPEADAPAFVFASPADLLAHLHPVAGKPLTFETRGLARPAEVTLIPFYQNHFQRYSVYWPVFTPDEYRRQQEQRQAALARDQALDARTLDRVRIGDGDSERAHAFASERSTAGAGAYGERLDTHYRDARPGGWFAYRLKVAPDAVLACTYWGRESGSRTFDILAGDRVLATQSLTDTGTAEFYTVETPIPEELTRGNNDITLRFVPHEGNMAGGIFDLRILKK